jgi:hypothetical protein
MRGWAILGIGMLAFPAAAAAAGAPSRVAPPTPTPEDPGRRLSDAAFASGHAAAPSTVTFRPIGYDEGPAVAPAFLNPAAPTLGDALTRPLDPFEGSGLRLSGQVQARTIGDFLQGRLRAMGVKDGDATYGSQGRFYLFAAVKGQAVGMNLVAGAGGLHRDGWTSDSSSALIGDGQVGLGWRKGAMEADIGYVHRGMHIKDAPRGVSDSYANDMAAISFTFRPH